jgi:mono/diheme cytochrome c family protein
LLTGGDLPVQAATPRLVREGGAPAVEWETDMIPHQRIFRASLSALAIACTVGYASIGFGAGNPYSGKAEAISQGKNLFSSKSCSGCHGAGGGGGMGPPVINDTWIYGSDDATLFDLIKLGSVDYRAKGHERKGKEAVVGDMPAMGGVATDDEIWKMIAFMRSAAAPAK